MRTTTDLETKVINTSLKGRPGRANLLALLYGGASVAALSSFDRTYSFMKDIISNPDAAALTAIGLSVFSAGYFAYYGLKELAKP